MAVSPSTHPSADKPVPPNFEPDVAIVGLGYVGLPLAITFAADGVTALGLDVDHSKVDAINAGASYIEDVTGEEVAQHVRDERLYASTDFSLMARASSIIIAVPTPLNRNREPDLSLVEAATREIAKHLRKGQLVTLESTTYPGTTRELMLPILAESGLEVGVDFFLAYSPERVDPSNEHYNTKNIPKVVGGVTPACATRAQDLYGSAGITVHKVSTPDVAELTKLFENIFRSVNIALVNELALLCDRMGINIWEVIDAAATKPFGFMKFAPGPGLGGHCIPIDPFYLTWKAREYDFSTEFIELAGKINSNMPYHCLRKIRKALNSRRKPLNGAKVFVLGMSYKKDVSDYRESPAIKVLELLERAEAEVRYHDPFVPQIEAGHGVVPPSEEARRSVELTDERIAGADVVVVLTDHSSIDWEHVVNTAQLTVDFRNVLPHVPPHDDYWKL